MSRTGSLILFLAPVVSVFAGVPRGPAVDAMNCDGAIKPIAGPMTFYGVAMPYSDGPAGQLSSFGDSASPSLAT